MERRKRDPKVRFLEKVKVMESGCHEWQSTLHRDGYGKFWMKGKQMQAHRMSYEFFKGPAEGLWVLHTCDNRKCVNPEHLFLGSRLDNIQDMDKKGRRGSQCKLTEKQVGEVREMLANRYTQQHVADLYGVSQGAISRIHRNVTRIFKH